MKILSLRKTSSDHMNIAYMVTLLIILCAVIFIFSGIIDFKNSYSDKQIESVKSAIYDSLITCYSLEGKYPNDLEYLSDNYGVILDKDKFIFRYELIGSNLFPDYDVISLGKGNKKGSTPIYQEGDPSQ